MIEAYQEKMDITRHLVAWHAANVMNVHTKKHITVDKLLGKKKEMTSIEREEEITKLRQALMERRAKIG